MLYIFRRCSTISNFGREMKSYVIYLSQMLHKSKFWKRNEKLCYISVITYAPQIKVLEEKWSAMLYIFHRCSTNPNSGREMKSYAIYLSSRMLHKLKFWKCNGMQCNVIYLLQMLHKLKFWKSNGMQCYLFVIYWVTQACTDSTLNVMEIQECWYRSVFTKSYVIK